MDFPETIRSMLTDCDDPVAAIEKFQSSNSFSSPVIDSALPLLDLLGPTRYEYHSQVLLKLTEALGTRLSKLSEEQKVKIVGDLIPGVTHEPVQTLLKDLLCSCKGLPEDLLSELAQNPVAYACCPLSVKREIWELNTELFTGEVHGLFERYVAEKAESLLSLQEPEVVFFDVAPRARRQHAVTSQLVDMIGTSLRLYETLCGFLHTLFGESATTHYCSLRIDVLMALHEAGQTGLTRQDPYHKFIWCLDACVREHTIDEKRIKELSTFMNQHEDAIDMAIVMVTLEPSVLHLLCTSAIGVLGELAKQCKLPRESATLKVLLRLLNISLIPGAEVVDKAVSEPELDAEVIHRHMPILVNVCTDMDGIALYTTLQFEMASTDDDFYSQLIEPLQESFPKFLASSPATLVLTIHLAARTAKRGCSRSFQRLIHSLAAALSTAEVCRQVPSTVWYHFFREISKMSEMPLRESIMESLGSGCVCMFVMEKLIVPVCRNQPDCLGLCLRLLIAWPASVRSLVGHSVQQPWLEALRPVERHSDSVPVWKLYWTAFATLEWPTGEANQEEEMAAEEPDE